MAGQWYGGARAEPLGLDQLEPGPMLQALRKRRRRTGLLLLEARGGIPCVAAISHEPDGGKVALGFAARPSTKAAAEAATNELADAEFRIRAAARAAQDAPIHRWLQEMSAEDERFAQRHCPPRLVDTSEIKASEVTEGLRLDGVSIFLFDLTRPEICAPVIRAVSPDLTRQRARFRSMPAGDTALPYLLGQAEAPSGMIALPLLL